MLEWRHDECQLAQQNASSPPHTHCYTDAVLALMPPTPGAPNRKPQTMAYQAAR